MNLSIGYVDKSDQRRIRFIKKKFQRNETYVHVHSLKRLSMHNPKFDMKGILNESITIYVP